MAPLLDEIAATVSGAGLTNVSCASLERHHAVNTVAAAFDADAATGRIDVGADRAAVPAAAVAVVLTFIGSLAVGHADALAVAESLIAHDSNAYGHRRMQRTSNIY